MSRLLLAMVMLAGCAARPADLPGSRFKIPVYSPSQRSGEPAAATLESEEGSFTVRYYELTTRDSLDQVKAFYGRALPQAGWEETALIWIPPDAQRGERVKFFLTPGKIVVAEQVRSQ